MRKALTLIELILSMVIIGIVFTIIPRLIQSMNQSAQVTIKEEAMYNAMALMGAIINLPWDENNTVEGTNVARDQILQVIPNNPDYDCNSTKSYRKGGFIGGRNCRSPSDGTIWSASSLGLEGIDMNDVDDYAADIYTDNNCSRVNGKKLYTLIPIVHYVKDPAPTGAITLSDENQTGITTNTKRIIVKVGYHGDSKFAGQCIAALEYHAFNIGQIQIYSQPW